MDFQVRRDDLHEYRFVEDEPPRPEDGQALLEVESFGMTANNITYAVFGEAMNYWDFFPAPEGWGRIPMWGFARVASSAHEDLPEGTRVFGYLPPSTHLLVRPDRVGEHGFTDASPHRAPLPATYQAYRRTDADPAYVEGREDEQILFWPLFYTSFLIDDLLADSELFGAKAVLISSASSKTSLAAAFLIAQRAGVELIGLTSPANAAFVERTGVYDHVVPYEEVSSLPRDAAVFVDVAGNFEIRAAVHHHYGDALTHSAAVGATHWDRMAPGSNELPGPTPTFFFAPDRVDKRASDWGPRGLEERVAQAWRPFVEWTSDWLEVRHGSGPGALEGAYLEVLEGRIDPAVGHVISPAA